MEAIVAGALVLRDAGEFGRYFPATDCGCPDWLLRIDRHPGNPSSLAFNPTVQRAESSLGSRRKMGCKCGSSCSRSKNSLRTERDSGDISDVLVESERGGRTICRAGRQRPLTFAAPHLEPSGAARSGATEIRDVHRRYELLGRELEDASNHLGLDTTQFLRYTTIVGGPNWLE